MIGTIGSVSLTIAFLASLGALISFFLAAQNDNPVYEKAAALFYGLKGALVFLASGLLVYLLFTNQFQYFYVYNYTSTDLQNVYLAAAYYSGQEGSFLLWILCSFLVGLGLLKWTSKTYRAPVMFFMSLTQLFLLSMVLGVTLFGITFGADPFRLTAQEFAHLPVFQNNPGFIPEEGSGLNDLLRSPWIVIHPPIIFLGFAMMTVPFAFAMASLWKRKYHEWIHPAFPWTLGANLCLLVAIFLGGYWAYETLSFGGYWAWDPVENASLVPWILGMAGVHTMLVQKKSATSHKASLLFAILAYATIIYQTFLTRSGVLGEASVHSFVDLGLYNQLLLFLLAIFGSGLGLFIYRYKELPVQEKENPFFSREFTMFAGAMMLFLTSIIIIVGTSSPIIGRFFVANPTPPEPSFYNQWNMPFAIAIAILSVITQYLWWNKYKDGEAFAGAMTVPTLLSSALTILAIILFEVREISYMIFLFAGIFSLVGNGMVMVNMIGRNPKMIGGTITHIGFAILLIGFLGSAYDRPMLDAQTSNYNAAVQRGEVFDDEGFPEVQEIGVVILYKNRPKLVNNEYLVTFKDVEITHGKRPGEQEYTIHFENVESGREFEMSPLFYPMIANSTPGNISWTVEPDIRTGLFRDMYLYVSGSSLVERENERIRHASTFQAVADALMDENAGKAEFNDVLRIAPGNSRRIGQYNIVFNRFIQVEEESLPEDAVVAVLADVDIENVDTKVVENAQPMFALIFQEGENRVYSPVTELENFEFDIQFENIDTATDEANLRMIGIENHIEDDWVLINLEKKPLVSIVWLGTFILMFGFSISIVRRWNEHRKRKED